MPGSNELFIIIAIFVAIFFLIPRMKGRPAKKADSRPSTSGNLRLFILASLIWPAIFAAMLEPWKGEILKFVYIGIAPVLVAWGLGWVMVGFKKEA